jgi:predicted amidohydrolase
MNDVTRILSRIEQGELQAAEHLLPLVYDELRKLAAAKLAHEKPGRTLQATAFVLQGLSRSVHCYETFRGRLRGGRDMKCSHALFGSCLIAIQILLGNLASSLWGREQAAVSDKIRVASVQAKRRLVDWRLTDPQDVLAAVDKNLSELEALIDKAGERQCDVLAFPEDTLGLLNWLGMNEQAGKTVLPAAVARMLARLGRAAAKYDMYLVVCSDHLEADGNIYNTAFFLGRDGQLLGRYHKTCPTWSECATRSRGQTLPVFPTQDLGTVGMLICYDLVFPETARCLALAGADIIFFPTMGGAAVGDDDIGLQALRVRAAENHVYLVVAFRGRGSMIISPRGKILAEAEGDDGLAVADIDPRGGRQGGDAMNHQSDMRARLFRERNPAAFQLLTDPRPPILERIPIDITQQEAGDIAARVLTIGEEEFADAAALVRDGKRDEAVTAFRRLVAEYPGSWIERVSRERLKTLLENSDDTP